MSALGAAGPLEVQPPKAGPRLMCETLSLSSGSLGFGGWAVFGCFPDLVHFPRVPLCPAGLLLSSQQASDRVKAKGSRDCRNVGDAGK